MRPNRQGRRPGRGLGLLFALLALAACGSGDPDCKAACARVTGCGLKTSGLSCDQSCAPPQDRCAICVNDRSCAEIQGGQCQSACPGVSFTK